MSTRRSQRPVSPPNAPAALILVDHGSRLAEANRFLDDIAATLRNTARQPYCCIEAAHMELAAPSVDAAFRRAVAAGARHVVVALFFLSPGRHSTRDIPRLVAAVAAEFPGVTWSIAPPLGSHPDLARLIFEQAARAHTVIS